jgi:hypothetical protein
MKNIYRISLVTLFSLGLVLSCVNEDEVNQGRPGFSTGTPGMDLLVSDTDGNAVAGATVTMFATEDDYITEQNSIGEKTTDANGSVSFTKADLAEPGVFYFSVASGSDRNWSSTVSSPYMYLASGPTKLSTTVAAVLPEFLALIDGSWKHNNYTNADVSPPCNDDDTFTFLKTGTIVRVDAGAVCDPTREAVAAGTVWGEWAVSAGGIIDVTDYDPYYFNNGQANSYVTDKDLVFNPSVSAPTSIVIDTGGGYVWTLDKM